MSQTSKKHPRLEALFSGAQPVRPDPSRAPEDADLQQLKAQVAELETQLAEKKSMQDRPGAAVGVAEAHLQQEASRRLWDRAEHLLVPVDSAALEKRIGLWVTGIFAVLSVAFFIVWLNIALFVQRGVYDVSDLVLVPMLALMLVVNLTARRFIRRDRPATGLWAAYLVNVILAPVLVVLVLENMYAMMGGYLVLFAVLFDTLVLPKAARRRAAALAVLAALSIAGIEAWQPAFRISTNNIQNAVPIIAGIAALGLLALAIIGRQLRQPRIQERLTVLVLVGALPLLVIVVTAVNAIAGTRIEADANRRLQDASQSLTTSVSTWLDLNTRALLALTLSPEIRSMDAATQQPAVRAMAQAYPYMYLISTTDRDGFNVARSDEAALTDYSDRLWFQSAAAGAPLTYQTLIGRTSGQPALVVSMPIRDSSGRTIGVGMFAAELNAISNQTQVARIGQSGFTYVVDLEDQALAHPDPAFTTDVMRDLSDYPPVAAVRAGQTGLITFTDEDGRSWRAYGSVLDNGWAIIAQQPETEILAPVRQFQNVGVLLVALGGAVLLGIAWFTIRRTLQPIATLTETIVAISEGDLTRVAEVKSRDEVGVLAATFNIMTAQLRGLIGALENRVAERTHDLELAAEVGKAVSEKTANLYELLNEAVELIRERFDLYYTQIYLTDPTGRTLVLRSGTGEVGAQLLRRGHHLAIGPGSLNGRAASEKRTLIVPDTQASPDFLPNPLLPDTRSELSVPLITGGVVVGVLDVQSHHAGALNESNLPAFEAVAAQLAIAIQNAALFEETRQARLEVEAQVRRLTERGWREYLDAIERGEKIGFAFDQSGTTALKTGSLTAPAAGPEINAPISVAGAQIGAIQVTGENDRRWSDREIAVLQATAAQLAQHIENLRLLTRTEKYRAEAEQALRRLTREGWETYLKADSEGAAGFVYDLNSVQSITGAGANGAAALRQPLIVRNETIGELALDADPEIGDTREIVRAVAQQLSGHIENLRLASLSERRAYELATVATVSTTASTVLDPNRLLQSVVDMTCERFGLYHAHIYLLEEDGNALRLAAGAGSIGRQMTAEGHSIPIDAERSLVARAARERQAEIVNDVRADPGFLPNPRLPETRSEMAVPVIVGDRLLGVFDVQSDRWSSFGREDADIYATLAAQVAVALQNARLYVEQSATVAQLRELDRLKSSFLANMSHELRTPLNSILGFADVMLEEIDGPLTPNMSNDLQLIHKNGQHLLHLINDVLDMAKIEAGKMNLSPEEFRIHETLEEAISITSPLAAEKSIPLNIDDESDRQLRIVADRTRIRQVLINLVNNAVKFTEQGEVRVRVECVKDHAMIRVRDTGVGIASDQLEAVFQEFTQVDTSTTRKAGGTGLGLPISRRLIDMHGGRMWVESTGVPGEGCTFYVELPLESRIAEPIEKRER